MFKCLLSRICHFVPDRIAVFDVFVLPVVQANCCGMSLTNHSRNYQQKRAVTDIGRHIAVSNNQTYENL